MTDYTVYLSKSQIEWIIQLINGKKPLTCDELEVRALLIETIDDIEKADHGQET